MITGGTGEGAEGFAEIREQFSAWADGKSAYDVANFVIQQMTGSDSYEEFDAVVLLQTFTFEESYAECSVTLDGNARITEASFEMDFMMLDTNDADDYYVDGVPHIQLNGTLNVSYDAFTLTPPSKDQLLPDFGTPQIDANEGSIVIPVEWNSTQQGDAHFEYFLSCRAWTEEGYYVGSGSFDVRNITTEQTQDGIFIDVDLTESWAGLRQTIDQLLADDYSGIPFRYEIRMTINVYLYSEYHDFECWYWAEGEEFSLTEIRG